MDKITFDNTLGIPEDEQKEILDGLDTLTKNNLASTVFVEKNVGRRGSLFPLLVNVIAVVVLAGGLIMLWAFQSRKQEAFVAGEARLSGAERQLIAEIRKETAERLNAKDMEIADIREKLANIDIEIMGLQKEDATEAIEVKIRTLMQQKDEYQARLARLQAEKGKILEEARLKENTLKNRNDELSSLYSQAKSDLTEVQERLYRIIAQGEKADVVENQFRGYYAILDDQVKSGSWNVAEETISAMRELLETPSLQGNRFFQAQKDSRRASLDALSSLIAANLFSGVTIQSVSPEPDMSSERDSENQERIANFEKSIAILEKQNAQYEKTIATQERTINNYKNQENNLSTQQRTVNDLRAQNAGLQQTITANNAAINDLRAQNAGLQQTATANNATINDLRAQNAGLQQTATANNATINDLRTQNEALQQRTTQLQQQNDAVRQLLNNE
jgi:chromosome segregation ATPase